jgi:plasmid stabilization system protein ParE
VAFRIEFAADAERELDLTLDQLVASYEAFGESPAEAFGHGVRRVRAIRRAADGLAAAPYRGTLHAGWRAGLRHVMIDGAVYWFVVDEDATVVRILAVFFGGQDHERRMLIRLFRDGGL